jgi:hypothetical protein
MQCFVLQDWITIRGASQASPVAIPQAEQGWLDLTPFQDVFFWLEVRQVLGSTPTITFETSPTADETLFRPIVGAVTVQAGPNPVIVKAPMSTALVPVARFVRWKLLGPVSTLWDVTFRVVIAANSPGM